MTRLQQIRFAERFRGCTDGHGLSMPTKTRRRVIRKAPRRAPSASRVRRAVNKAPRQNSVVIADANPEFLCDLASVLEAKDDFVVVASCQNEAECIAAIHALSPSLAVLDMSLSDSIAFQVLTAAKTKAFTTRVAFLSSPSTVADAARALSMGAGGVLPKDSAPQSLIRWLRQVNSGQLLVPLAVCDVPKSHTRGKRQELVIALTARERQIMELVSAGLSNREVGEELNISEGTIKVHLHHIFQKLSVRNRTALANFGRMHPWSVRPQDR